MPSRYLLIKATHSLCNLSRSQSEIVFGLSTKPLGMPAFRTLLSYHPRALRMYSRISLQTPNTKLRSGRFLTFQRGLYLPWMMHRSPQLWPCRALASMRWPRSSPRSFWSSSFHYLRTSMCIRVICEGKAPIVAMEVVDRIHSRFFSITSMLSWARASSKVFVDY